MARRLNHGGFVARRTRDRDALVALLEPAEPRTTHALSDHLVYAGTRANRTWLITGPHGRAAGAVVLTRLCFDRWGAGVYLAEPEAGPVAAAVVQRSPAWHVAGAAADIRPLLAHLPRAQQVYVLPWGTAESPITLFGAPDPRTRVATMADLEALVELYAAYESFGRLTRWQLRSHVRQLLRHHQVIVFDDGGGLVAAAVIEGRTRRYVVVSNLTVLPAHRESGIGNAVATRLQAVANGMQLGATWTMAPSNPMSLRGATWDVDHWYEIELQRPRPFKGAGRLRRLYSRYQPTWSRERVLFRDPTDPDRPPPSAHA